MSVTKSEDPIARFEAWLAEARESEPNDPEAMCLATATPTGAPTARMVLLKDVDQRGFTFYTNLDSRKGTELLANPLAALTFHWKSLRRQVRVEGKVEVVDDAEADAYFATRGAAQSDRRLGVQAIASLGRTLRVGKEGGPLYRQISCRRRAQARQLVRVPPCPDPH